MQFNTNGAIFGVHFKKGQLRQTLRLISNQEIKGFDELASYSLRMYEHIQRNSKSDFRTKQGNKLVALSCDTPSLELVDADRVAPIRLLSDDLAILNCLVEREAQKIKPEQILTRAIMSYLDYKNGGLFEMKEGEHTFTEVRFKF